MSVRTLINTTNTSFVLNDLLGKLVEPYETFDGYFAGETILKRSADVASRLLDGSLKLNDGSQDVYGMNAVNLIISGEIPRITTRDGKPIVAMSDRPQGTLSQMVGCGDDIENSIIGAGTNFILQMAPSENTSVFVDTRYCTNVWIRGGTVRYTDAQLGTHINLYAVAPPGAAYPCPNNDGTLDFDYSTNTFIPNTNNTGKYKINNDNAVIFDRFFTKKMILGDGVDDIMLSDPHHLITPYYLRLELIVPIGAGVDPNKVCKVVATQIIYREKTLTNEIVL